MLAQPTAGGLRFRERSPPAWLFHEMSSFLRLELAAGGPWGQDVASSEARRDRAQCRSYGFGLAVMSAARPLFHRYCCKSLFALVIKNSPGCRRDFRKAPCLPDLTPAGLRNTVDHELPESPGMTLSVPRCSAYAYVGSKVALAKAEAFGPCPPPTINSGNTTSVGCRV